MNQITGSPIESTFGYEHNYGAWAPNSRVTLCKVNWNASYRDAVYFTGGKTALNTFIDTAGGETVRIDDAIYLRMGQPIDLDIPFNVANTFNYLRVYNPAQPITSPGGSDKAGYFYYFITGVESVAPNTTRFNVQLDAFQTFIYNFQFGQCFVERSHSGIAADNAFDDHGRAFLNIPEGIDVGGEYTIAHNWSHNIASARGAENYDVLIMTTTKITGDLGDVDNPVLKTATGSMMENLPSGANIYLVESGNFLTFMQALSDRPYISQGIIHIQAIPNDAVTRYSLLTSPVEVEGMPTGTVKEIIIGSAKNPTMVFADNWRDEALSYIPAEYRHLKKLLTFPYMALEFTTYAGQPIILKPESWDNDDAMFVELPHLVPGSAKIVFYPVGYNRRAGESGEEDGMGVKNDGGEFLDMATSIGDFPSFSLVNNSFASYMASNRNGIAFAHQSADWSQQRALTGSQLSFDQAQAGMDLTNKLNDLGVQTATSNTNLANQTASYSNLQGGVNSLVSGGMSGTPNGAINGARGFLNSGITQAITQNQNNQALNISTHQMNAATNASVGNSSYMADTNLAYAKYAARGDNQNAIAGITAKVQDAKLLQPTTSGQVGGNTFNLAKYQWGVDLKLKMMQGAAMRQVAGVWMRYGYQMNMWTELPSDFHCMTHFTYWKLRETYVTAADCPEAFKETIRGIFEKGVTVWRNPADIGRIPMTDNLPVGGFTI